MKNKLNNLIVSSAIVLAVNPVYADKNCKDITFSFNIANPATLVPVLDPVACGDIENKLQLSGRYLPLPSVQYLHYCYASAAPIPVKIGSNPGTVTSLSAFTDNSDIFGTDIGTVNSQLTFRKKDNTILFKAYTQDHINLLTGWEEDIIVGTTLSVAVVGNIKVQTIPNQNPQNSGDGSLWITALNGRICSVPQ